ncbi:hypothetical protein M8J76_014521 [Diaphorina citri]|nr:hypothetical protein M8J75_012460 [Diaphorina citri]KAI5722833.1 hypothetical protein M8J76_014521 [Diaphorina citri]
MDTSSDDEYSHLMEEYMENNASSGLSTENPTSSTHDLREQIIQYWSQAVDEDVKDVTVLFLKLKKENKRLFEGSFSLPPSHPFFLNFV